MKDLIAQVKSIKDKDQEKNQKNEKTDMMIDKKEKIVKIVKESQDKGQSIKNKKNITGTVNRNKGGKNIIRSINNIKIIRKSIKKTDRDQEIDKKNKIIENSIILNLPNASHMFLCIFLFILIFPTL